MTLWIARKQQLNWSPLCWTIVRCLLICLVIAAYEIRKLFSTHLQCALFNLSASGDGCTQLPVNIISRIGNICAYWYIFAISNCYTFKRHQLSTRQFTISSQRLFRTGFPQAEVVNTKHIHNGILFQFPMKYAKQTVATRWIFHVFQKCSFANFIRNAVKTDRKL